MKNVLASQEELDTFYAVRPEWFESDEERTAFAAAHPELVEQYSGCWQEHTNCLPTPATEEVA
jgi:hypothetical protein